MPRKKAAKVEVEPVKKRMGRKPREFDQKIFESLCHVMCTFEEMEHILDCDRHTLDNWCNRTYGARYSEVYKRFSDGGKASLRRNQFNLSKTNAAMAIWLGKQWLNQKELPYADNQMSGALITYVRQVKERCIDMEKDYDREDVGADVCERSGEDSEKAREGNTHADEKGADAQGDGERPDYKDTLR